MSMGAAAPVILEDSGGDEGKRGKLLSSSNSASRKPELKCDVRLPASAGLRCQERSRSFSLSDLREEGTPKPRGVLIGVDSREEQRSLSLFEDEK